ncbi:ribonuclease T2 family protein [Pontixanthobacter aquaemixtae]|nr:ribonuclease T [Pontixanthobacter aquaemixtae]
MPQSVPVPKITPDAKPRRLPVTGYTLAASWSPEFCKGRETQARHRTQCSTRNGRFAFVAHGLWPESRGSWPQWCRTSRVVSSAEARRNMCMMPSARLIASQWAKHGSCMVSKPESYFKITRILWRSITFPPGDQLSREDDLTAGKLRDAFIRTNPAWPREAIGVNLNRRGWLRELRLCYGKDFMPKWCDKRRFGARDSAKVKIWRGL